MNYRNPELRDRLASEYVLGTLTGLARKSFERLLRDDTELANRVQVWQTRFQPLAETVPPMTPSAGLLQNIERQLGFDQAVPAAKTTTQTTATRQTSEPKRQPRQNPAPGFWQRLFAPIPMGALAMGLVMGLIVPRLLLQLPDTVSDSPLLPASYVGVLADAQGHHGIAISSLRQGKSVDVKLLQTVNLAPDQTLFLWAINRAGAIIPVGPIPNSKFGTATLPDTSERLFADVLELAVSVEHLGVTPKQPDGPFLFRGLCGKFWR